MSCNAREQGALMAKHQVEYANVVIRAGDRELLDIFEESVRPVFEDR